MSGEDKLKVNITPLRVSVRTLNESMVVSVTFNTTKRNSDSEYIAAVPKPIFILSYRTGKCEHFFSLTSTHGVCAELLMESTSRMSDGPKQIPIRDNRKQNTEERQEEQSFCFLGFVEH